MLCGRRRDVEPSIRDSAYDVSGTQVGCEADLRHQVEPVLDQVQRLPVEQDAVAVRHALAGGDEEPAAICLHPHRDPPRLRLHEQRAVARAQASAVDRSVRQRSGEGFDLRLRSPRVGSRPEGRSCSEGRARGGERRRGKHR